MKRRNRSTEVDPKLPNAAALLRKVTEADKQYNTCTEQLSYTQKLLKRLHDLGDPRVIRLVGEIRGKLDGLMPSIEKLEVAARDEEKERAS